MPIRMTDDPNDPNQDYNDDSGGGGRGPNLPGGGGGLMSLLPMLLGLFKGKGIIALLVIAGGAFFLFKSGTCNVADVVSKFSQSGYNFNPSEFNKASVYEGLADDAGKNPLPEAVSLLKYAPARENQGQQGSCVAWSCAYASQTILTAAATGADPNSIRFSPSYLYNQIKLEGCQGSYLQRAMEAMQRNGGVSLRQYPYNDQDCESEPSSSDIQAGRQNLIHGFTRITNGDNINEISVRGIKEHLNKNAPVAIGMMVGESFMQGMKGQDLWTPQGMDESQMGMGGHAMSVIGYDDRKYGGAFQIMNSWGADWGNNGVAWVRYGDFKTYVREAYGIDPLPKRSNVANIPLECTIGLVNNDGGKNIPLRVSANNIFQTTSPIAKGTRFKMSIENATECYIYVFGMEVDNSSYVLFPYLKTGETVSKHSPYCGITGYRLFPKAQSMEADSIGNRDFIAIVVSKDELDYNALNAAISNSKQVDYYNKVNEALQSILIRSARFNNTGNGNIYFKVDANSNKAVACVVAIDKQ
ncbi:MAG TPA: C1 family peptidase [Chitinophagaceae bacterium]|nr:peptidase C1A papain [Chitinophagaceae bacterium]MBP7315700.1 peptidase C1A papain [Chitinophagaceae bacterium]HQV55542.1 C1 family peptidase [Chitinophagaceae bacterium]HQX97415.1 C1 family peptidase [Chitinophagaceae bacterium]HQZ51527.1 C1 family peptidase [Chitinophagaceae bacterium]